MTRPLLLPLAGLALPIVVWGLSVPLTKLALRDFGPLTLIALRYLVAAPFFMLSLIGRPLPPRRALAAMAGLGVLGIDIGQVAQALGVRATSASVATVIAATIPLFVVAFAALWLRQPIRLTHFVGLLTALLGLALVTTSGSPGAASVLPATLGGDALVLLSAISIALYYVLGFALATRHSAVVMAAWSSLFAALPLIPILVWEVAAHPIRPGYLSIGIVLYLALLVTVAGMWIWLNALRALPVRIAAGTQYLQPLVGVAASAAIFGDRIRLPFAIGTALVLAGIALSASPGRNAK
ncbi:MAG: DMT family transporter [Methylobacteriaceae bacterium]|nr:DMT family transporter [Methylobacteriaceae bacterium]